MQKKLFTTLVLSVLLMGCSNGQKVPVAQDASVSYVGAVNQSQVNGIRFSEEKVTGEKTYTSAQTLSRPETKIQYVPEKATAICNDGTYSMALLNEACLSNGGVKTAISRHHAE